MVNGELPSRPSKRLDRASTERLMEEGEEEDVDVTIKTTRQSEY